MRLGAIEVPYGEVWLLETAVSYLTPITFLAMTEEEIRLEFNHASHHLSRSDLLDTLCALFDRGHIIADRESRGTYVPSRAEIDAALVPPGSGSPEAPALLRNGGIDWGGNPDGFLYYGLSQAGGSHWEGMAEPDWGRYFSDVRPEEHICEVIAGSQQRLEELLGHTRELWDIEPGADGIERDAIMPWEATYWKTLSVGYRARFRFEYAYYASRGPTLAYRTMMIGLRRWCRSIWQPAV